MMKNDQHIYPLKWLAAALVVFFLGFTKVAAENFDFRCLDVSSGLADCHVSSIHKDRNGFLWIGTAAGLSRYDGFRFKNFYHSASDPTTLVSNQIETLQEDAQGNLWVLTNEGYSIYNPDTESFDNDIQAWMQSRGMQGYPDQVYIDRQGCIWIFVKHRGLYFFNPQSGNAYLFAIGRGRNDIPAGNITGFAERGASLVASYNNGLLVRLDGRQHRVVWVNRHLASLNGYREQYYKTFIDSQFNYWVSNHTISRTWVYSRGKWYDTPSQFLASEGMQGSGRSVFIKDMRDDRRGNLWIATEHEGLYVLNIARRSVHNFIYEPHNPNSLPDNTLQNIYVDPSGAVWIGTYKNGVAYYSPTISHYPTLTLGDVCAVTQDRAGRYWCGTNDAGIVCFDPTTQVTTRYTMAQTGLGSDVVVSSLCARDGSLWFGTFGGGLLRYADGRFSVYRAASSGLAEDRVWSLAEDLQGRIVVGTLGSGVQCLDPATGVFTTYNSRNSGLQSDYVSSVMVDRLGNYVVGHSAGVSVINPRRHKVGALPATSDGSEFSSNSVNEVYVDSRGLIWNANMSGLDVYDPDARRIYHVAQRQHMAYAVTEDAQGNVWASLSTSVIKVKVSRKADALNFFINTFDELDGLQKRRFNYRSLFCDQHDRIVVGGQDGINIIPAASAKAQMSNQRVMFSGIVLFDHELSVGERYNRHTVLQRAVNSSRELHLNYDENAFSVLLASDAVSVPQKSHFLYRLKGFADDKWFMTVESQPSVTYTNLSPGHYTLEVRVVGRDGNVSSQTSELKIVIAPPFWLSWWAYIIYLLLGVGIMALAWYLTIHRQMERMRIEQMQREAERKRKADEMKLTFLTDISHELRTPLSLVITPVEAMIEGEDDEQKRSRLQLILRNARRLLDLVNQTLDLRKIEANRMPLDAHNGNIVTFVSDIVDSFSRLAQKHIALTFSTDRESLVIPFDADKINKVLTNLLSNAYKFTPEGGQVQVSMRLRDAYVELPAHQPYVLEIMVADTGCGISDADKLHVFDRFYQVRNQQAGIAGGSGLGLNIAMEYVAMHGGRITVADNTAQGGRGTVFTVMLPVAETSTTAAETNNVDGDDDENTASVITANAVLPATEPAKKEKYEVLVVDDSDDFLAFMTEMLEPQYRVRTALNGKDALEKMVEHRPDAILSDVMMPEMDGNTLCRAVKDNADTRDIPFIMLTARLSTECKIEGFTSGADEYITKPFNLDLLNLRIARLIAQHRTKVNSQPAKLTPRITEEQITSVDQKLVDRATAFVEQQLSNADLSVEMMSEALGMSRVNLYKRMLSVTGTTPSEFIRNIRLRHAARLLSEGQLNVSEVAYRVGFNNPRYFSKYFTEMFGQTPSQYRHNDHRAADSSAAPADAEK